ncbi:hypothetical protein [Avibacterium volantium]|uniref:hypothetical protein n=1 Tax=Avibacterium volantium TaxID=762 RepID=UPI003BF86751
MLFNLLQDKTKIYTPDTIVRNIKQVKKGIIEIKRYSDARMRQFFFYGLLLL